MRPFSGHPARVRTSSPPGCGVGEMILLPHALQVSTVLDNWSLYSTDIGEVYRSHLGPFRATFDPSCQGGWNCKNRDCAWSRCAVVPTFWACVLVSICEVTMPLWCCRVDSSCLERSQRLHNTLLFLHLVCLFSLPGMLFTHFLHYLESGEPPCMPMWLQGESLHVPIFTRDRSAYRLLTSLPLHGSMFPVPRGMLYLRIPRIFVRPKWVNTDPLAIF